MCYNGFRMTDFDILVIGGGAAGFFGAITAAEHNPALRILILERGHHPLAKVRVSGGGRCNVTHACFDPAQLVTYYPRGAKELRGPFTRFQPRDTVTWFTSRGVTLKTEPDGRMFPTTDQSQTIIDCLLREAARFRVQIKNRSGVKSIRKIENGFVVHGDFGRLIASKVLLAPGGGHTYTLAESLGHTIIPPVPSLFTFNIRDPRLESLAGISVADCEGTLSLRDHARRPITARGPVLVTHWGLSGPVVLRLSAWGARTLSEAGYRAELFLNLFPPQTTDTMFDFLQTHKSTHSREGVLKYDPNGKIPVRFWRSLAVKAGVKDGQTWADTANRTLRQLAAELTRGVYPIQGKGQFKEEFVTCGGVDLRDVNFKTMESRVCPGLFLAGEILNIDGLTGGFNFQAAWTTGWLAGLGMAAHKG